MRRSLSMRHEHKHNVNPRTHSRTQCVLKARADNPFGLLGMHCMCEGYASRAFSIHQPRACGGMRLQWQVIHAQGEQHLQPSGFVGSRAYDDCAYRVHFIVEDAR